MKRTLLVAGLSIAVLCGASVAMILALSSFFMVQEDSHESGPASSPLPTSAAPDPPSRPSPPIAVAPAPPGPPVASPFKGGKVYPSATDVDLRSNGGHRVTQKAVRRALRAASVQSRLARCTQVEGFGKASAASLVLELEARGGELRVVDANVREWGGASEAMVSCARAVLLGQVIAAPKIGLSAGERMQMHFRLNPRGVAVVSR